MRITYKQRIFLGFFVIFVLFTFSLIVFEQKEEKLQRTHALESNLESYTEIIHSFIKLNGDVTEVDSLLRIFPADLRITVIGRDGMVLYDNDIANISNLENHLDRPEIKKALFHNFGTNIRMSASVDREYLYYAKYYSSYYVRVALPYNVEVKSILSADRLFIYVALVMLVIGLIALNFIAGRFSLSILQLKKLTTDIKDGKDLPNKIDFPNDEVGEIGEQLMYILRQKEKGQKELETEKEKLVQHFQFSQNGLCIFDENYTKVYSNARFMQYLNLITDGLTMDTGIIFKDEMFQPIQQFLKEYKDGKRLNNYSLNVTKNRKFFEIQTVIFEDNSFEIAIKDITELEKNRLLKQEMTSNIAHELRTPVTSLRAYLETLNEQNLPIEKQTQFIDRAYHQAVRLSSLLEDISLISKIEEASSQFKLENINLYQLVNDVRIDLIDKLSKNNVGLNLSLKNNLNIQGNYTLLYSVFRNLIENSIEHGGSNIQVYLNNYMEDSDFLYFSFYDTGKGVAEQHLNRLFERFYRADEGRTRELGGSGLGLSIVRNAIKFHRGEIQVKNRKDAGIEFLFTLKKSH